MIEDIKEADGILLLCPLCFQNNGGSNIGVHSILLYQPHIPQEYNPTGGRWSFLGTGLEDLELVAASSSIQLEEGCKAHFFIRNGAVDLL